MKNSNHDSFWPSYTDLMTSLFFIMLVLFLLVYIKQSKEIENLEHKLEIITAVEENLKPLKSDSLLFTYEEKYKRFKLAFDVQFVTDKSEIKPNELERYFTTIRK